MVVVDGCGEGKFAKFTQPFQATCHALTSAKLAATAQHSHLRAMPFVDGRSNLNSATQLLLAAVSGVPEHLLEDSKVLPQKGNLLRFPWYGKSGGGGAFVMGRCVYMSGHFFDRNNSGIGLKDDLSTLLLIAHEVGHLPHSARFRNNRLGQVRFISWAAGIYVLSFLQNGGHWHRKAWIEQEADRGRWVLGKLITPLRATIESDLLVPLRTNDVDAVNVWLIDRKAMIAELHAAYPGWE